METMTAFQQLSTTLLVYHYGHPLEDIFALHLWPCPCGRNKEKLIWY